MMLNSFTIILAYLTYSGASSLNVGGCYFILRVMVCPLALCHVLGNVAGHTLLE